MKKRAFDLVFAFPVCGILIFPMIIISLLIKLTSKGPIFYWSERVGKDNRIFNMLKFRTMDIATPVLPTHLLKDSEKYVTVLGKYLRRFSLDELPQLFNILKGDLSFVGPRPALFNQNDLIQHRTEKGIYRLTPGLTGWAQVNGRDNLSLEEKVELDQFYLDHQSFLFDLRIIFLTFLKVLRGEDVKH